MADLQQDAGDEVLQDVLRREGNRDSAHTQGTEQRADTDTEPAKCVDGADSDDDHAQQAAEDPPETPARFPIDGPHEKAS